MNWDRRSRRFWRTALQIHEQLHKISVLQSVEVPTSSWDAFARQTALLQICQRSGWKYALDSSQYDLERTLTELTDRLKMIRVHLRSQADSGPIHSVVEIWRELIAIQDEFVEIRSDLKNHVIKVTTEPIELEGVDFGRFQIVLDWHQIASRYSYTIEALDPYPAESKENLFHPHVNDGVLCEGDGQAAIRQALHQGRLFDFFVLVRQVLFTYNRTSAYLTLDKWSGFPCRDCGEVAESEELLRCRECLDTVCTGCAGSCNSCCEGCCQGCQRICPHCENYYCPACLIDCSACGSTGCDACLADGRCPDCQPQEDDDESQQNCNELNSEDAAGASLHPLCMGEAVVPA